MLPKRLLLVEDDRALAELVSFHFDRAGYAVTRTGDGEEALILADEVKPDLVLLDWMIEGISGIEVCRRLRRRQSTANVPIIMLTARGEEDDRIRGLETGADDYLTKPFSFRELTARIRALLRRDSQLRPDVFEIEDLVVDAASHRVSRANDEVQLTAKEYALLEYLARRAGQLVSRAEIAAHVWDDTFDPFSNAIEVYINRLRKKIDGKHSHKLLHTRRGEGYILESRR